MCNTIALLPWRSLGSDARINAVLFWPKLDLGLLGMLTNFSSLSAFVSFRLLTILPHYVLKYMCGTALNWVLLVRTRTCTHLTVRNAVFQVGGKIAVSVHYSMLGIG